ncbi:HNH endonuclease [Minwuia sp. IMCC3060]|uniref:WYL domain-containing protein n=1 Tax=Minwuia sp. IMCC3060 TaxID=3040675 RepID=UPI002478F2F9|nr:HNH endonuclease [Minwuia sp. IMCC3060]
MRVDDLSEQAQEMSALPVLEGLRKITRTFFRHSTPESQYADDPTHLNARIAKLQRGIVKVYDHWPDYPPDWQERREAILHERGAHCENCGSGLVVQIHHRRPLRSGGSHKSENLQILCRDCHLHAHGTSEFWGDRHNRSPQSASSTKYEKNIEKLLQAIDDGNDVRFIYFRFDGKKIRRRVTPHRIDKADTGYAKSNEKTVLHGFCHKRGSIRSFSVFRIRRLILLK